MIAVNKYSSLVTGTGLFPIVEARRNAKKNDQIYLKIFQIYSSISIKKR